MCRRAPERGRRWSMCDRVLRGAWLPRARTPGLRTVRRRAAGSIPSICARSRWPRKQARRRASTSVSASPIRASSRSTSGIACRPARCGHRPAALRSTGRRKAIRRCARRWPATCPSRARSRAGRTTSSSRPAHSRPSICWPACSWSRGARWWPSSIRAIRRRARPSRPRAPPWWACPWMPKD